MGARAAAKPKRKAQASGQRNGYQRREKTDLASMMHRTRSDDVIAMTKHTDLQVITSNAAALPALAQKIFADWKTFRLLMKEADYLADEHDKYGRILDELESYEPTGRESEPPSADYLKLDGHMKNKIARCGAWLDKIDSDDLYDIDEHGDRVLKKTIVADRLGMMLSTLVGEPSNPKAALAMMLQHIFAAELSYPALESGCRDIEAGPKPYAHRNPGEFLKVFTAEEERWRRRLEAISGTRRACGVCADVHPGGAGALRAGASQGQG